jgi:hypothetical protein
MKVACTDLERIFRDGDAEEWLELERHAETCPACAQEIRAWKALSVAAEELRDYQEDPALWSQIERRLIQQREQGIPQPTLWERLSFWRGISLGWQTALASALVLLLTVVGGYVYRHRNVRDEALGNQLLKSSTLAEVERTEREYMKAIDKLAMDAKPQLDSPASPLLVSYREKLLVIDGAISELRTEAGQNPSNAHLRYQLLAMYQEKQQTLEEVLETRNDR